MSEYLRRPRPENFTRLQHRHNRPRPARIVMLPHLPNHPLTPPPPTRILTPPPPPNPPLPLHPRNKIHHPLTILLPPVHGRRSHPRRRKSIVRPIVRKITRRQVNRLQIRSRNFLRRLPP